jgi:hypothetical protein
MLAADKKPKHIFTDINATEQRHQIYKALVWLSGQKRRWLTGTYCNMPKQDNATASVCRSTNPSRNNAQPVAE